MNNLSYEQACILFHGRRFTCKRGIYPDSVLSGKVSIHDGSGRSMTFEGTKPDGAAYEKKVKFFTYLCSNHHEIEGHLCSERFGYNFSFVIGDMHPDALRHEDIVDLKIEGVSVERYLLQTFNADNE